MPTATRPRVASRRQVTIVFAVEMRRYVEASAGHENVARTERLLERIVPDPKLHARFVNTLARLEYVGVRKILKSRRAERLDLDGIQHILDEAVHALRLKKAAAALGAASGADVTRRSPPARRWPATRRRTTCRRSTTAPRRRSAISRPASARRGQLPSDQRRRRGPRAGLLPALRAGCLKAHDARVLRRRHQQGRGSPPRRDGGRPRRQPPRLAAPARAAARPPRRRSSRGFWARLKRSSRRAATRMAEWRKLGEDDVRAILRDFGVAGYRAHQPIAVGTINTNVRGRDRRRAALPAGQRGEVARRRRARGGDRRPRGRARRPHAGAARGATGQPFVLVAGRRSSRCSPGCPAGRSSAPSSRPRTRRPPAPRWRGSTWRAPTSPITAPAATSPTRSTAAWRASRRSAAPSSRPRHDPDGRAGGPGRRARARASDGPHSRRSLHRQRPLRRRRRSARCSTSSRRPGGGWPTTSR